MNTKHMCVFIAFNLLSFLSFTLMATNPTAGVLCLLTALGFGMVALPAPARQGRRLR